MNVKISLVTLTILMMSVVTIQCIPIDILSQLTDSDERELLYKIAEFFNTDYIDDNSSFGSTVFKTSGVSERQERCRLPMKRGLCRALLPRWSYDPVAQQCIEFKFGGYAMKIYEHP